MGNLIEVRNLKKYFKTPKGMNHAVDDVTFSIEEGKTVGVVGESGCGKSTLGRTILHVYEPTGGQVIMDGEDITKANAAKMHEIRRKAQMIFQDPYSSLNPRLSVKAAVQEPMRIARKLHGNELKEETDRIMNLVGIDKRMRNAYPHELDGGRRQRVGIARALAMNPKFIVCDEPVSALDVSIQAQILNLLQDLQQSEGLTYMFVTHDMSVVRHISDFICVMYLGQMVETSPAAELFSHQFHPYTKALMSAIPSIDIDYQPERIRLTGELTSPINPQSGCRFAARCDYATEQCVMPQILKEMTPGHFVACCRAEELNS